MKKTIINGILLPLLVTLISVSSYAQEKRGVKQKALDANGQPNLIVFDQNVSYSLQDANTIFNEQLKTDTNYNFVEIKSENDKIGFTHKKFQEYYNGVKIEFATYTLHAKNGKVQSMSGEFYKIKEINTTPAVSKEQGLQRAMSKIGAEHYLWEDQAASKELGYSKPEGELVLLPIMDAQGEDKKSEDKLRLAYKYEIFTITPLGGGDIYVDAQNGSVLFYNAKVKHVNNFGHDGRDKTSSKKEYVENVKHLKNELFVSGTAQTRYSGTQTIETTLSGSSYTLNDAGRKVYTRDANNQAPVGNSLPYISSYSEFTDSNNSWTEYNNSNKDNAALDAHWGAEKTYDYWSQIHGRSSYDNAGAQLRSYVHVDNNYDNAFWYLNVMSYGDGSSNGNEGNGYFDALTSIDVAGHEIGHAVCEYTANLAYQRESGGMNEGFSDIWGAAIEHFAKGNGNDASPSASIWLIGDEIDRRSGSAALRSMSNPQSLGQPDTYGGTYWVNPNCGTPTDSNDYCGVHTNSGVLNHWFYLLTAGGSGSNDNSDSYNVTGIGMSKASNISYRLENNYLSANSTYANARTFSIQAATDLYGSGSQEVISVTNAWYAVGVGAEFVQTCSLAAPSNFSGSSINDNGFTLSWSSVSGAASYAVSVNGTSTTVSGTTYTATGLISGTSYSCSVSANCSSGGSGTASSTNVTTTGTAPLNYCSSNGNSVSDEYIGRVQLGTIDNSTGGTSGGYANYTSLSTDITKGSASTITITPVWTGTKYNEGYSVWIDYNKDGDFSDSGEQVWTKTASQTTPVSGSFTVPTSASNGATRMRVSMKYNGVPTACEAFSYGEVEDYTVNIITSGADTTAPSAPTSLTASGTTQTTTSLSWTASTDNVGVTSYDVYQGSTIIANVTGTTRQVTGLTASTAYTFRVRAKDAAGNVSGYSNTVNVTTLTPPDTTAPSAPTSLTASGTTQTNTSLSWTASIDNVGVTSYDVYQGSTIIANVTGTTRQVTGLAANTAYTFRVRAKDAAGNVSGYSNTVNVTTLPNSGGSGCTSGISSFPYSESFESGLGAWTQATGDDLNWTRDSGGTPSGSTGPSTGSNGSWYMFVEASSPNYPSKRAILNSPCFDLSSVSSANFTFDYHMYGANDLGSISVEASNNNGSTWANIWTESGASQGNSWKSVSLDLTSYIGGSVQLRFNRLTGDTWQADIAIDNVGVSSGGGSSPSCSNVNLSITFDNYPEETAWSIVNASGTTVASGGTYGSQADGSTLNIAVGCLDNECYDLIFTDVYGDGICCSYGNGSYTLTNTSTGATLASGGSFTSSQTTNFCLSASTFGPQTLIETTATDNTAFELNIYPNPVKGNMLNVKTTKTNLAYSVVNMLGQEVARGTTSGNSIDVSSLESGMYMIQFSFENKVVTKKFIKE